MKLGMVLWGALFVACLPVLTPAPGEYPCGIAGHSCGASLGCCQEDEICGHTVPDDPTNTCPAGMCCYVGPPDDIAPQARKPHPQTPKRTP